MLIRAMVENFKSFDKMAEISMISSSKIQTPKNHRIKIKQTHLLKHAVIYGANASGKSNLIKVFSFIQRVLKRGLSIEFVDDYCRNNSANKARESTFELQFTVGDRFYAYGFSCILEQTTITAEWLYELKQDGGAKVLFTRDRDEKPILGEEISLTKQEKERFAIYAEDFVGRNTQLFLAEMNNGKKYADTSKLKFFVSTFTWLVNHIHVIHPERGLVNGAVYYDDESLHRVGELLQTFDTGITSVTTKKVSQEELSREIPKPVLQRIIEDIDKARQREEHKNMQVLLRSRNSFFQFKIHETGELEVKTLEIKHGDAPSAFSFKEESDGTRRLFELLDMILTAQEDAVFVVDELERSLHPKLTEYFLKLFMKVHKQSRIQLLFTTHEDVIMNQALFRRDEIWFVERTFTNSTRIYSLDRFKERYDKKLSRAYLEGRYGAIPVFQEFSFAEGE